MKKIIKKILFKKKLKIKKKIGVRGRGLILRICLKLGLGIGAAVKENVFFFCYGRIGAKRIGISRTPLHYQSNF